jgi:hypothetical protein
VRNNLIANVVIGGNDVYNPAKNIWIHHNEFIGGGHQNVGISGIRQSARVTTSNAVIEHNLIRQSITGIDISDGSKIMIRNNLIIDNNTGVSITQNAKEVTLVNNTIARVSAPPDGVYYQGKMIYPTNEGPTFGVFVRLGKISLSAMNNIIAGSFNTGIRMKNDPGAKTVISHNIIWGALRYNIDINPRCTQINNNSKNPLFVDFRNYNFNLQPDSPAIDRGQPDILDPDGSVSNLGAYGGPGGNW